MILTASAHASNLGSGRGHENTDNSLDISVYPDSMLSMKQLARIFKALSDETRLRIIALLSNGELCVCDLMAALDLPQSTVSRHLAYLRHAGLVEDRRNGVWMFYRLPASYALLGSEFAGLLMEKICAVDQAHIDQQALKSLAKTRAKTCS